jgi:hypothetical protein
MTKNATQHEAICDRRKSPPLEEDPLEVESLTNDAEL